MTNINADDKRPIFINVKFKAGKNPIGLAAETIIEARIKITDGYEIIKTNYARFTQDLVKAAKLNPPVKNAKPYYSERIQAAIISYPGLNQEEIAKIVAADLKKVGVDLNGI